MFISQRRILAGVPFRPESQRVGWPLTGWIGPLVDFSSYSTLRARTKPATTGCPAGRDAKTTAALEVWWSP